MLTTGLHSISSKRTLTRTPRNGGRDMSILTQAEKTFLDVFLHEATTSPFKGPATSALHAIGVEYGDISYLAWAYAREVPRNGYEWGHSADMAPPVPWSDKDSVRQRNMEVQCIWEKQQTLEHVRNA